MVLIICPKCNEEKEHQAKGLCYKCYKKYSWAPKKIICKRCKRERNHHTKGLCGPCANFLLYYDQIKKSNYKKWHNIDLELYRKITKKCEVCEFDKAVDLHHLDGSHKNNSESNLLGLCPNHHKMIHNPKYSEEVRIILVSKGFVAPINQKEIFSL